MVLKEERRMEENYVYRSGWAGENGFCIEKKKLEIIIEKTLMSKDIK